MVDLQYGLKNMSIHAHQLDAVDGFHPVFILYLVLLEHKLKFRE